MRQQLKKHVGQREFFTNLKDHCIVLLWLLHEVKSEVMMRFTSNYMLLGSTIPKAPAKTFQVPVWLVRITCPGIRSLSMVLGSPHDS